MAILITTISGILSAISLLFISKAGWLNVSRYVITIFLVTTSSAAFFGGFPLLFKQKQNIDENKKLFLAYSALANQVLSYAATGEDLRKKEKAGMKDFIHRIDTALAELYTFPIELEPSAIPDLKKILKETAEMGE